MAGRHCSVATEGLQNYGQDKVAMDVTRRFLKNVQHTYDREQKLVENERCLLHRWPWRRRR